MSEQPPDGVRIMPVEEVAERTGIPAEVLRQVRDGINAMLNDADLKRRVDAAWYSGSMASLNGFEWYCGPDNTES